MTRRSLSGDDQLFDDGPADASTVPLRRVEPTVHRVTSPVDDPGDPMAAMPLEPAPEPRRELSTAVPPHWLAAAVVVVVAFGIVSVWSGDIRIAFLLLLAAVTATVLRIVDGRTRLSFGQGFIGYRADGWPVGVQEDDDMHWSWHASARIAAHATAGPELRDRT